MKQEFFRFLENLKENDSDSNVSRIANLVVNHFDDLAPLGTAAAKRVQKIIALASVEWAALPRVIQIPEVNDNTVHQDIQVLSSLLVGPFRGFAKEEILDLGSPIVLIYGPNGTGKSSFCEALELSLLGTVEEGQAKRFTKITEYFRNAHTNTFAVPILSGSNTEGKLVRVQPDESIYRFCFVEKNRIDQFSRMAAFVPAKQVELIATLFGLDAFTDFVRDFSSELDGKYIDLEGVNGKELGTKRLEVKAAEDSVRTTQESLLIQEKEELALASKYALGISYADFLTQSGVDGKAGEMKSLETELSNPLGIPVGITTTGLAICREKLEKDHADLAAVLGEFSTKAESLSYKSIYDAVKELGKFSQLVCPACKTPISETAKNPFELADSELEKLKDLDTLQASRKKMVDNEAETLRDLNGIIKRASISQDESPPESEPDQTTLDWNWFEGLLEADEKGSSKWQRLLGLVEDIEKADRDLQERIRDRETKTGQLAVIRALLNEHNTLSGSRKTLEATLEKANKRIKDFAAENAQLIEAAEAEKSVVAENLEIAQAYKTFVLKLTGYKDQLPSKLVADLGSIVVSLYNDFNRHDAEKDKLLSIKLPTSAGERIEVEFQGKRGKFQDALHILSEGHIRCIGLSILMAKNLKERCKFLIFDDPVNAIDSEHRNSIRLTLFEKGKFDGTQIILTCHGEEFFKDIQAYMSAEKARQLHSYTFLPQHDENHIQINFETKPRNYVILANDHIKRGEIRDSLMSCRRALEALNIGLWESYWKKTREPISVSMRQHNKPWDTRNLTEQLRKQINKTKVAWATKETIIGCLDKLLGISGDSLEWTYLNKGTHEELDLYEFDAVVVRTIVEATTELDKAVVG